jgi:hypothetical protein
MIPTNFQNPEIIKKILSDLFIHLLKTNSPEQTGKILGEFGKQIGINFCMTKYYQKYNSNYLCIISITSTILKKNRNKNESEIFQHRLAGTYYSIYGDVYRNDWILVATTYNNKKNNTPILYTDEILIPTEIKNLQNIVRFGYETDSVEDKFEKYIPWLTLFIATVAFIIFIVSFISVVTSKHLSFAYAIPIIPFPAGTLFGTVLFISFYKSYFRGDFKLKKMQKQWHELFDALTNGNVDEIKKIAKQELLFDPFNLTDLLLNKNVKLQDVSSLFNVPFPLIEILLLKPQDINIRDEYDITHILKASSYPIKMFGISNESERKIIIQSLLEKHADANLADENGDTPLTSLGAFAEQTQDMKKTMYEIALMLINANADVRHANNQGFTPLHRAVEIGNPQLVKLLLEHGATPLVQTSQKIFKKRSPLELAIELAIKTSDLEILEVLVGYLVGRKNRLRSMDIVFMEGVRGMAEAV